jgi:hypothetical protein
MTMPTSQEHFDTCRQWQEYFDGKLRAIGMRAPAPVLGETVADYRRKVLVQTKKAFIPRTHELRQFSLDDIRGAALDALEPQILEAAAVEAVNPANVERGTLRKREEFDEYGAVKTIKFYGQDHFAILPNFGVDANVSFGGGARPGRRARFFNRLTSEWYPPVRR